MLWVVSRGVVWRLLWMVIKGVVWHMLWVPERCKFQGHRMEVLKQRYQGTYRFPLTALP